MSFYLGMTKRIGRMSKLESLYRKQQFARLLLDIERNLTPQQICEEIGISMDTYQRWASDTSILDVAGLNGNIVGIRTRQAAYAARGTIITTLIDVMEKSRNDLARVRAAEFMYQIGQDAKDEEGGVTDATSTLMDLLNKRSITGNSNTFIVQNAQFNLGQPQRERDDGGDDDVDVIEGQARIIDQKSNLLADDAE